MIATREEIIQALQEDLARDHDGYHTMVPLAFLRDVLELLTEIKEEA